MELNRSMAVPCHDSTGEFRVFDWGNTMIRERALKVVLVLVGLLFLAGVYPVAADLWQANPSDTGDDMMLSL